VSDFPNDEVEMEGFEGDTFLKTFTIKDDAGNIIDITGATFRLKLGSINESTSGVTITNGGATGEVEIKISYTAMEALAADDDYEIALEMTDASGVRTTLFTGTFTVLEDVR